MRRFAHFGVMLALTICAVFAPGEVSAQETGELIQSKKLPNGLTVITMPSPSLPIVTIEICVKNGAFTEPAEFNGLSHLYEHMFFKGNAVIPNQEAYLRRMRQLGIVFNGTTSTERVNYYFTLPSDNLEEGLVFMKNAITTPKFDSEEFEKEKQVVIGEIDRNESNPYYWFNQAMSEKLWSEHPSRKDPLGDRATVQTATVEKMRTMKERYYVPNNSVLVVAGDVDPEKVYRLAEKVYRDWKRGPEPFAKWPVPEHPPLAKNEYVVVEKDVKNPFLELSWHGPSVDEDPSATFAADVLSYILGQPTSNFHKSLVDSGITLNADLGYYTQKHTGPISLSAQVRPEMLEKAVPALLAEIDKLTEPGYFTDQQLENAKTMLAIQDRYSREKISSFAHTVSFWWASAGLDYYVNYIDNLQQVTRDDIRRYVDTYIANKPMVAGVLLSSETAGKLGVNEAQLKTWVEEAGGAAAAAETVRRAAR